MAKRADARTTGRGRRSAPPTKGGGSSGIGWLVGGTVVAVAAAVVLVMVVTGGDDESTVETAGLSQFQPSTINGTPLPTAAPGSETVDGIAAPVAEAKSFNGISQPVPAPGKPTLIAFGAHWCPHCQASFPVIVDWIEGGGAEGVDAVAVATGTSPDRPNFPPSAWFDDLAWPGRSVADDEESTLAQAYGLQSYPYLVFIDGEGKVRYRISGEMTPEELDKGVEAITG